MSASAKTGRRRPLPPHEPREGTPRGPGRADGSLASVLPGELVSFARRFWRHVEITTGGCWLWTGSLSGKGYGRFHSGGRRGRSLRAHRVAYELLVGPIPDGLQLDHVTAWGCTSKACVNPAHLEPVTNRVNVLRGVGPTAQNAAKTHCFRGHPFDDENTQVRRDGHRRCRECIRQSFIQRNELRRVR